MMEEEQQHEDDVHATTLTMLSSRLSDLCLGFCAQPLHLLCVREACSPLFANVNRAASIKNPGLTFPGKLIH